MMHMIRIGGLLVLLAVIGCAGGDGNRPVFPVKGRLTIDGVPAKDAYLVFYPTKTDDPLAPKPSAIVQESGELVVTTYNTGDGAPSGEYKVGIEWPKMVMNFGRMQPGKDQLNGKFKSPDSSKWTVTIQQAPNTIPDFDLKTK